MDKVNILINEKLHDASITSLKYKDNNFYIKVDCGGMNLSELFTNLDNIYFTLECININKLEFDFENEILIDELIIDKSDKVIIKNLNGDLYLECDNYTITNIMEMSKKSKEDVMLDKILRTNI